MICYSAVVIVIFRHYVWPPCFQLIQLIIGVLMQCIIVIIVDNIIKLFSVLFWVLRVQTVDWVFKISIYSWRGFWPVKTCCSRLHLGDLSLAIVTRKSDQIKKTELISRCSIKCTVINLFRVWSIQTGEMVNTLIHHCEAVLHLRFSDGIMVTCSKVRQFALSTIYYSANCKQMYNDRIFILFGNWGFFAEFVALLLIAVSNFTKNEKYSTK